jgi:hypothetical protein
MFYIHDGCSCPSLASSHSNGCPSYPPSKARTKQGVLLLPNSKAVTVSPPCLLGRDSCPSKAQLSLTAVTVREGE